MKKILLFDIDGTLLLLQGAGRAAVNRAAREAFGLTDPAAVPLHGNTDRGIVSALCEAHGIEPTPVGWARFREAYLEALSELMSPDHREPLPGVRAILARLATRRADVAVGLLTGNVRQGAERKLAHFRLLSEFDHDGRGLWGGFGDDHPLRDDVARAAWAELVLRHGPQYAPRNVWVIGDTVRDVACAKAIGVRCLAVATGGCSTNQLQAAGADHVVDDLSPTSEIWERLELPS